MKEFARNNWVAVLCLVLLGVVLIAILAFAFRSTMDAVEWREETYIVRSGDSLWAIADKYCPEAVDRREWISEVKALNDLSSSEIYAGQMLTVLAPAEEG